MSRNAPHAARVDQMASFLEGGFVPELAMRWLKRHADNGHPCSPSAQICRGLLSTVLRASSKNDAWHALDALQAAQKMPISPLERLGFSSIVVAELPAVLEDLLGSVLSKTPLLSPNPALTFYSTAGVGSTDEAEFEKPDELSVRAATKRVYAPSVDPVRSHNGILVLEFFAAAFDEIGCAKEGSGDDAYEPSPILGSLSRDRVRTFWKNFYVVLPTQLPHMSMAQQRAVLALFRSLVRCEPLTEQDNIAGELHTVFSNMCRAEASPVLGVFARMLNGHRVVMKSTLMCLLDFMSSKAKASGRALTLADVDKPMTISVFSAKVVRRLLRKTMDARALSGVPALLSSYTEAWLAAGPAEDFIAESPPAEEVIDQLNEALGRLEGQSQAHAVVETDVIATRLSILAVCARVLRVNEGAVSVRP